VRERAEAAMKLTAEHGFPAWEACAAFWYGWALAAAGEITAGSAQMRSAIAANDGLGVVNQVPFLLGVLADIRTQAGDPTEARDLLIEALATLIDLPWHLTIVGDARDPATAEQVRAAIDHHKLEPRTSLLGAVMAARLAQLYALSELFVLPSRYEGFGMAYAEAIAHGLPVIGTTAGAIPETVPDTAGVLVPPDDVPALAAALRRLIESRRERAQLAEGARIVAKHLPTWAESAKLFSDAIERVV